MSWIEIDRVGNDLGSVSNLGLQNITLANCATTTPFCDCVVFGGLGQLGCHFAGEQLQINQPHVYDCHVPPALASSVPSMVHLCGGGVNVSVAGTPSTPANRSVTLTSLGGSQFISFAKGASFNNGGPSFPCTLHTKWSPVRANGYN